MPSVAEHEALLRMIYDDMGHLDLAATQMFLLDQFWWHCFIAEISKYVTSCKQCQLMKPLLSYKAGQRCSLTRLFRIF